jgi:type I restriction enzyme S subunit
VTDSLPRNWRLERLGDCSEIVSGATPRREVPNYWGGSIPWVTPKDISDLDKPVFSDPPESITEEGYRSCSTRLVPIGSILFSSRAPIGLVAIAGRSMCTNQGFKSVVPGAEVDSHYLYYCLKRLVPRIRAMGNGATFKEVSKEVMERVEIPLPPHRSDQERIVDILDKADAIRRKRRQALAETSALPRAVFLEMFGDPLASPSAYDVVPLEQFINPSRPITYGILMPGPDLPGGVPYVRVLDMQMGRILVDQVRRTSKDIDHEYRRSRLRAGDLLLSIRGHVGRTAVVPDELDGANITQDTARLAARSEDDSIFLRGCIETPGMQRLMGRLTKGGAVKGINLGDVKRLPVPLPPARYRARFAEISRNIDRLSRGQRDAQAESENLFASLSQRAFRGELQ